MFSEYKDLIEIKLLNNYILNKTTLLYTFLHPFELP